MSSISEATRRHHVSIRGNGAVTLVFAHGYGCDQSMWRLVAPSFEDNCRVVTFDHIGSGQSDLSAYGLDRHASLKGYAEDVIELIDDLEIGPVVFVGHSVSAMIGALAAIRRPDLFSRLVMIGPSPRYLDEEGYSGGFTRDAMDKLFDLLESNYLGWSSFLAPAIIGNPDRPQLGEDLTASFCRQDREIAKRFARVTFLSDNRSDLPKVTTPTLILQCSEDIVAGDWVGQYTQSSIKGSRLIKLKATGHCPNLSHPEEVVAVLKTDLRPDILAAVNGH